jgi:hypothetical protein
MQLIWWQLKGAAIVPTFGLTGVSAMKTARFVVILFLVVVAAGATIGLAWFAAREMVLPVWQAGIGPLLLATMLFVRWRTARMESKAAEARAGMTPGE